MTVGLPSRLAERLTQGAHVWLLHLPAGASSRLLPSCLGWLDAAEQARAEQFREKTRKADFVVAHAFLRATLSRYLGEPPSAFSYLLGPHGRPELGGAHSLHGSVSGPRLRFNLSHTEGLVACVVTAGSGAGIDVERRDKRRDFLGMARTAFAPSEREALEALPEEARQAQFYQIWTLKEAYIKAIGLGLSQPLDLFSFELNGGAIGFSPPPDRAAPAPGAVPDAPCWHFLLHTPTPEHQLALALERQPRAPIQRADRWPSILPVGELIGALAGPPRVTLFSVQLLATSSSIPMETWLEQELV